MGGARRLATAFPSGKSELALVLMAAGGISSNREFVDDELELGLSQDKSWISWSLMLMAVTMRSDVALLESGLLSVP